MPVGEDEPFEPALPPQQVAAPPSRSPARDVHDLTGMLIAAKWALKVLSQKTIVALASLVDLSLAASVFVMWVLVIAQPSILQLVGLGGYAVFVLLALFMRRNK